MQSLLNFIEEILKRLLIGLGVLIVAAVTWQVFSRYILQSPSSGTEELARFTLIWMGVLGAAYAYQQNSHLGLDIVVEKLSDAQRPLANIFTHLAVLSFAVGVMIIGGVKLVLLTLDPVQTSAALQIKMGYVYSVVPLAGALICIFGLVKIQQQFAALAQR